MKRINSAMAMMASVGAILAYGTGYSYVKVDLPTEQKRGQKKRGGGRGGVKRINTPHYKAWKKVFGGVAGPDYAG